MSIPRTTTPPGSIKRAESKSFVGERRSAWACFPGCGSHLLTECGVDAGLRTIIDYKGISGGSGGAGVGSGAAFGILPAKVRSTLLWALKDDRVLDLNPFSGALASGDVIEEIIQQLLGKDTKLGDSPIPLIIGVHDLDSGKPQYFDSRVEAHKSILMYQLVARSMSIPGVFPPKAIPSHMLGLYTPDIQLKWDVGVSDNTLDHVFDSEHGPRIAIQLYDPTPTPRRVYKFQPLNQAFALFEGMLFASGELKSKRDDGYTLRVPRHGDGFDFSLSEIDMSLRYQAGYSAVREQRDAILNHLKENE